MAGKRWASEAQLELVRSYLAAYDAAQKGTKKDLMRFWPILETAWFANFPHKNEMVLSGALPEGVLESGYEWIKDSPEERAYQKGLKGRKEQLKTLIRYEHSQLTKKGSITNASRAAIGTAAKKFVKTHRRCFQPQEMYYHLYKGEIEEMFENEKADYAEDGQTEIIRLEDQDIVGAVPEGDEEVAGEKPSGRRRGWNLRLRRKIFTREWEAASPERQEHVKQELERQRAQMALDASLVDSKTGLARDGESRLSSLQKILGFWASNAQMCWENAAVMSVQIGVAPDPSNKDQLVALSLCYGLDQNGKVFQDVHPGFTETFTKPIVEWAQANVFTPAAWQKAKKAAADVAEPALSSPEGPGDTKPSDVATSQPSGQRPLNVSSKSLQCNDGVGLGEKGASGREEGAVKEGVDDDDLYHFSDDQGFDDIHQPNAPVCDGEEGDEGDGQSMDTGVTNATSPQPAPPIVTQTTVEEPSGVSSTTPHHSITPLQSSSSVAPGLFQTPKPTPPTPFAMPKLFSAFAGQSIQVPPPSTEYSPSFTPPSAPLNHVQPPANTEPSQPDGFPSSASHPFPLDPILAGCEPSPPGSISTPYLPNKPHDWNEGPNESMAEGLLRAAGTQHSLPWPNMPPGYKFSFGRRSNEPHRPLEPPHSRFQFGELLSAASASPATSTLHPPVLPRTQVRSSGPLQAPPPAPASAPPAIAPLIVPPLNSPSTVLLASARAPATQRLSNHQLTTAAPLPPAPGSPPVPIPPQATPAGASQSVLEPQVALANTSALVPNSAPVRPRPRPTPKHVQGKITHDPATPNPASAPVAATPAAVVQKSLATTAAGVCQPPPAPAAPPGQASLGDGTPESTDISKTHQLAFETNIPAPPPAKSNSAAKRTKAKKASKKGMSKIPSPVESGASDAPEAQGSEDGPPERGTKKRKLGAVVPTDVEAPNPSQPGAEEEGRGKRKRVATKRADEFTPLAARAKATKAK